MIQVSQQKSYANIYILKFTFTVLYYKIRTSQVARVVKSLPANAGDVRDAGSIPGSDRSPRGGHGNPFQYSFLENPMDRGTRWATVHVVAKRQIHLSN